MLVEKLKNTWKEVTLLGAWIVSVTGSFMVPLPSWHFSDETTSFLVKFTIFIATVLAGFLVLYSLRNREAKIWMRLSVGFIAFFIIAYVTYFFSRDAKTLPYLGKDIVIGTEMVTNNPFEIFEETHGFSPVRKNRMMILLGEPEKAWTEKSIMINRVQLILLLFFCYLSSAGFIISFCNLIILYKEKYTIKIKQKKSIDENHKS